MRVKRILPYSVLVVIILFAFFKFWWFHLFSDWVGSAMLFIGINPQEVLGFLNNNSNYNVYKDHYLGWIIYYPCFLALHLLFVWLLFSYTPVLHKRIMIGLVLLIFTLICLIVLGKAIGSVFLFGISFKLFQSIFALPFLLFLIEGDRILLKNIDDKLSPDKSKND